MSCEEEGTHLFLFCFFFLLPKIFQCGQWSRFGDPALLPRLLIVCSSPSKQGKAKLNSTDHYTLTPSEGCRTGGHQRDPSATLSPRPVLSKPNPSRSTHQRPLGFPPQTWSEKRNQLPSIPERLVLISLGSCSVTSRYWAPLGGLQPPVIPVQGDSWNSHWWRWLSLPPHCRRTLCHSTNPTLICSPQLKQLM